MTGHDYTIMAAIVSESHGEKIGFSMWQLLLEELLPRPGITQTETVLLMQEYNRLMIEFNNHTGRAN
jgi:hypothetical protein